MTQTRQNHINKRCLKQLTVMTFQRKEPGEKLKILTSVLLTSQLH
jgi:hypothetical protein